VVKHLDGNNSNSLQEEDFTPAHHRYNT